MHNKKTIKSFRDLEVYKDSYKASIIVITRVISKLPDTEKFDLCNQLSRSCKAIPRLIAEGFAKKHQRAGFQKYIDDAIAECNETIVGLEHCRDIYKLNPAAVQKLVNMYDKSARQLYRLREAWNNFKRKPQNQNL